MFGKKESEDVTMSNSRLYATCPNCGKRICRAVPGSELDAQCPQCKEIVIVQVDKAGKVITQILEEKIGEKN
jgi:phage FluMu protein Com